MQNTQTSNKVIIIGAGLGGLTLAQGLKKAGIPFHVYERDPTSDFRAQGYRIRLNHNGGEALKNNLPPELFNLFERTCGGIFAGFARINALDGKPLVEENPFNGQKGPGGPGGFGGPKGPNGSGGPGGPGGPGPWGVTGKDGKSLGPYTVDRTTFRALLLLGLEENVTFGKEFERYEESEKGVTVHFKDGSSVEGGLLIGADGVRSRVRKQYLPESVVVDTDGRIIYGKTTLTEELKEKIPKQNMKGINIVVDKRYETPLNLFYEPIYFEKDVGVESNGRLPSMKDYIYWVLFSRKATMGIEDDRLWKMTTEEVVKYSLKLSEDWDPNFRSILELQDVNQTSVLRISSALPDIPFWTPSARVTLLGDAIHVMPPTGGIGANTALTDALTLCQALVEGGITAESVGKYEEKMRKYAKEAIEFSEMGGKKLYNQPPFEECKRLEL